MRGGDIWTDRWKGALMIRDKIFSIVSQWTLCVEKTVTPPADTVAALSADRYEN